ncbi:hypothetical protein J3F84DRAFT_365975 [Trichoderma pleuroticola]
MSTRGWRLANETAVLFRRCRHIPRLVFFLTVPKLVLATLFEGKVFGATGTSTSGWCQLDLRACVSVAFTPSILRTLHCLVPREKISTYALLLPY